MKFITVRNLRSKPSEVWKQLPEERDMILTANGKPIAILSSVSDDTFAAVTRPFCITFRPREWGGEYKHEPICVSLLSPVRHVTPQ